MRRDIELNMEIGDTPLISQNKHVMRDFKWVSMPMGKINHLYGEVTVAGDMSAKKILEEGLYTNIPYTPYYQRIFIRVCITQDDGSFSYVTNPTHPGVWYQVKYKRWDGNIDFITASELITISETGYYLNFDKNDIIIYSESNSDFNLVAAKNQNSHCLLLCNPGNYYRFPLTGVGLVNWINGPNINTSNLAEALRREFDEDGAIVEDAQFDYDTQILELNIKEK